MKNTQNAKRSQLLTAMIPIRARKAGRARLTSLALAVATSAGVVLTFNASVAPAAPADAAALIPGGATNVTSLDPHLEPLRPMLGKTWRGPFKNSRPDKPVVDILAWERALNGNAVRSIHSINNGSYGGETLYRWDSEKQVVTYHYFTTAGFMTTGTVRFDGPVWTTHEVVSGNSGGVTEVRATARLETNGTFVVKTEHRGQDGKWSIGRETVYHEDPAARVIFR